MHRWIETISIAVLLLVVALRPLVSETFDSAISPMIQALGAPDDPTPIRTLVFDLLILTATLGWLIARAVGPVRRYRRTGLEWGAALVLLAAVVSCFAAGNKRLAITASIDWLCYPVLTIALVQLLHRSALRRLLLAVVLASACAQAVQCFDQYYWTYDDTRELYLEQYQQLWADQGVELDSPKVTQFEQRMRSREATGFLPHSNVTGSYLMLCGLAALGVVVSKWRRARAANEWQLLAARGGVVLLLLGTILLTKSLGAQVACIVGLGLWGAILLLRRWILPHRGKALAVGWAVAVGGMLAVVGHGLYHGSLPGASLNFRWQYWNASYSLVADHALTGVARENFGRHYLQYKTIESPEEVANPHSLFVQAAADWGVIGLLGILVMLVGGSLVVARPRAAPRAPTDDEDDPSRMVRLGIWALVLGGGVVAGRLVLLGSDNTAYLYWSAAMTAFPWVLGFGLFAVGRSAPSHDVINIDPKQMPHGECAYSYVSTGAAIGVFAFLLHDMINFAIFVPGAATTLFALLAFCIADRTPPATPVDRKPTTWRWGAPAIIAGPSVALVIFAWLPVVRSTRLLTQAKSVRARLVPGSVVSQAADAYYRAAAKADPLDPWPHAARGEWLLALSSVPSLADEATALSIESMERAIALDPFSTRHRRRLMQAYQVRATRSGKQNDFDGAIDASRAALALYPEHPDGLIALADRLREAGEALASRDRLGEAARTYEQALRLDDARPAWEQIRRLPRRVRENVLLAIEEIRRHQPAGRASP